MSARVLVALGWRDAVAAPARSLLIAAILLLTTFLAGAAGGALALDVSPSSQRDAFVSVLHGVIGALALAATIAVVVPVNVAGLRRRRHQLDLLEAQGARPTMLAAAAVGPVLAVTMPTVLLGAALTTVAAPVVIGARLGSLPFREDLAPITQGVWLGAGAVGVASLASGLLPWLATFGRRARTTSRRWTRAALALGVIALGGAGAALATTGAARAAATPATAGVALVLAAGACALVLLLRAAFGLRTRSFLVLFALRDASRHLLRVAPPATAGAAVVAAIVLAMVFAGSGAVAQVQQHRPVAPPGAALATGRVVDDAGTLAPIDLDAVRAAADAAGVGAVQAVTPISVGQGSGLVILDSSGRPVPLVGYDTEVFGEKPLVLEPGEPDVYELGPSVLEAAAAGQVVVSLDLRGLVAESDGMLELHLGAGRSVTVPAAALLPAGTPTSVVLSPETAEVLELTVTPAFAVVTFDHPLTRGDLRALDAAGASLVVELGPPAAPIDQTQLALLVGGAAVLVLVMAAVTALSRTEARAEAATLAAVGAGTGFLRRVAFIQGGVAGLAACLVGIVPGVVAARVLLVARDGAYGAAYTAGGVPLVSVPWPLLATVAVMLPLLVAAVSAAVSPVTRNEQP